MDKENNKIVLYCAYANKNDDKTFIEAVMLDNTLPDMSSAKFFANCDTVAKAMAELRGYDGGECMGVMGCTLSDDIERQVENVRLSGAYNYLYEIEGFIKRSVFRR